MYFICMLFDFSLFDVWFGEDCSATSIDGSFSYRLPPHTKFGLPWAFALAFTAGLESNFSGGLSWISTELASRLLLPCLDDSFLSS